jgi:hypothetical protein
MASRALLGGRRTISAGISSTSANSRFQVSGLGRREAGPVRGGACPIVFGRASNSLPPAATSGVACRERNASSACSRLRRACPVGCRRAIARWFSGASATLGIVKVTVASRPPEPAPVLGAAWPDRRSTVWTAWRWQHLRAAREVSRERFFGALDRASAVGTGSSGRDSSSDGAGRGEFGAPSRNGSSVAAACLLASRRVLFACFFDRGLHPTMRSGHRRWQHRRPAPLARRIAARAVLRVCVMVRRGLLGARTIVLLRSCRHSCRRDANRASGRWGEGIP